MKILLDACVPMPLRRHLGDHSVEHASRRGWQEVKNGELLKLAEAEFDLFITSDKNLGYQQNIAVRKIAILVLWTNDWPSLMTRAKEIEDAVNSMSPAEFRELA
ncbi:DUF5615 family PIN-like protein [Prosthecobacter sp.]|uniref:DUF5615 family PIN-like protein n=1 Tax=Prosthecobacter sp. TaxID=1965333 RepID=UPI003783E307